MYKLLIVDDEPLIRKGILTLVDFEKLGITDAYEASNGTEGLRLFIQHAPQLILLDINLPVMNGLELAQAIKALDRQAKIAMITGYDYVDYAISALKIGVDDYILKPVSKQDVTDVIAKLIQRFESEQTNREVHNVVNALLHKPPSNSEVSTNSSQNSSNASESTVFSDSTDSTHHRLQVLIDQSLSNPELSLTSVAHSLGYAPNYLSSLFKNLFGVPFQEYVLSHRLEKAKLLLLTTSLKNYEIAERVGFEDVNYFNTRFKLKFGVSPKQYVTQVRQPNENK
ncbi:MAG TPA: response regulator [Fusibacter sp.]|nr:response regulator [Fusibacter sp.]